MRTYGDCLHGKGGTRLGFLVYLSITVFNKFMDAVAHYEATQLVD